MGVIQARPLGMRRVWDTTSLQVARTSRLGAVRNRGYNLHPPISNSKAIVHLKQDTVLDMAPQPPGMGRLLGSGQVTQPAAINNLKTTTTPHIIKANMLSDSAKH